MAGTQTGVKQYVIEKASKWLKNGEPVADKRGNHIWYVTVDGEDMQSAKKPGNEAGTGKQWGEITVYENGKKYFSYKKAPEGAPLHGQTKIPLGTPDEGKSWGQALIAAATLMTTDHFKPMLAGDSKDPGEPGGVRALESLARDIYMLGVPDVVALAEAKKAEEDVILTDLPEGDINLDDIPF